MRNSKKIVGVQVKSVKEYCNIKPVHPSASVRRTYEVLSADHRKISFRVTEEETWGGIKDGMVQITPGRVVWELSEDGVLMRNGDVVDKKKAEGYRWALFQDTMCTVLAHLYQEEFTGYEHNYLYRDGYAFEAEEGDMED